MDFRQAATKMMADIERPPLPPVGTYLFKITKIPEIRDVNDQWQSVDFVCQGVANAGDVDEGDLTAYGGANKVFNRVSFMFDKKDDVAFGKTEYQLKRFLIEHLKCAEENTSLMEGMNAAVNQQFLGTVTWKADKNDAELFHANITKTAPVA